jgi:NAD-dependent deacetylase
MTDIPVELIDILKAAQRVVALTGAGVSQESGLRTFRDVQSGLWSQYKPEDLASPEAFERDPKLIWDWYASRREKNKDVRPNPGHFALAEMARRVPDFKLITQNVDGLHQRAGSQDVIELHGNIRQVRCSRCGKLAQEWPENGDEVPTCAFCGGLLRPNVVWFGESLPRPALEAAVLAARACEVFFSIGTSGLVQPAASLAVAAKNHDAWLVQVNTDPEPVSARVDFLLTGKSGELLPEIVAAVWGR